MIVGLLNTVLSSCYDIAQAGSVVKHACFKRIWLFVKGQLE